MQEENGRTEQSIRGAELADTPCRCQPFPAPLHSRNTRTHAFDGLRITRLLLPNTRGAVLSYSLRIIYLKRNDFTKGEMTVAGIIHFERAN